MKTKVRIKDIRDDGYFNRYWANKEGYVDGYAVDANNDIVAMVVLGNELLAMYYEWLEVIESPK